MDTGELKALETELAAQAHEIEHVYERIENRAGIKSAAGAESLAFQLHNLYSAFEQLFEIVARAFENNVTGETGYHLELLRRMNVAVAGVRPPLVPDGLLPLFDSLRSFRHFFRHAYAQDIDRRKVAPVLEDARKLREEYPQMISEFVTAVST